VEVHERSARNVGNKDEEDKVEDEQVLDSPQILPSLQEFSSNTSGVQDHKKRVTEPKYGVEHLGLDEVQGVEKVSWYLDQRPTEDHQIQRPVSLRWRAQPGHQDEEQTA